MLRTLRNSLLCLILCCVWAGTVLAGEETLPDGVTHYYRVTSKEKKPQVPVMQIAEYGKQQQTGKGNSSQNQHQWSHGYPFLFLV